MIRLRSRWQLRCVRMTPVGLESRWDVPVPPVGVVVVLIGVPGPARLAWVLPTRVVSLVFPMGMGSTVSASVSGTPKLSIIANPALPPESLITSPPIESLSTLASIQMALLVPNAVTTVLIPPATGLPLL